jgi:hypothetical protein
MQSMAEVDSQAAVTGEKAGGGVDHSVDTNTPGRLQAEGNLVPGSVPAARFGGADVYYPTANFKRLGFAATAAILPEPEVASGYGAVAGTIGSGALNEVTQHPLKLGAIAVGTGVATELATAFLKRQAFLTIGGVATAWGAYQLYENVPKWLQSADVVAHGTEHTAAERLASQKVLKDLGAGGVDLAAGALGAGMARPVANLGRAGWMRYSSYTGRAALPIEGGLAPEALAGAGGSTGAEALESQAGKAAATTRLSEPYLRNDNIQVPRGMPLDSGDEGAVYDLPGDKLLKVKLTPITSAEEEANALVALGDQGVRVPKVYEVGKTEGAGADALVMQKLQGDTYREVVLSRDTRRLTNALHDFTRQVDIMARSGVAADDIQFKNLIIGPQGEVNFIDPLRIVSSPSPAKVDRIVQNMILNGARP